MVFLAAFALYASTAAPGLLFGDSAELQAAAITGGIPHATGYPAFTLVGRLFSSFASGDPARAVNLMSSFFGAAALGLMVLVMGEMSVGPLAATVAALTFGLSFTPWRTSLRAEVYGQAVALAMLALWVVLVARRTKRFGHVWLAGLLLGLTLTGHLAFAPMVAVFGLMLAWQVARGPSPVPKLVLLALAFVIGLTPYLFIAWADMHRAPINYFDLVRAVQNPLGHPMPDFDTPWKRLMWMLTGRNQYPKIPVPMNPKASILNALEGVFILFFFELGPIAALFAFVGLFKLWRRDASLAGVLLIAFTVSFAFGAWLQARAMLHIFLLPAMTLLALGVGLGVEALIGGMKNPAGRAVAAVLLAALMIVPGPFIREYADAHPFTKWKFHVEEEDLSLHASWFPTMRHFNDPERYWRAASAAIPESSIVFAGWSELNVLRYGQAVRGERKDLTLQQITPSTLPQRMTKWQEVHPVWTRPFVFTEVPPPLPIVPGSPQLEAVLLPPRKLDFDVDRGAVYVLRDTIDTTQVVEPDPTMRSMRSPSDLKISVLEFGGWRSSWGWSINLAHGRGRFEYRHPGVNQQARVDSGSFALRTSAMDSVWKSLREEEFFGLMSAHSNMTHCGLFTISASTAGRAHSVTLSCTPYPPVGRVLETIAAIIPRDPRFEPPWAPSANDH